MDNIILISQNVKLESLSKLTEYVKPHSDTLIISTQFIFENEAELINNVLRCKCTFKNFSDFMSDTEEEQCDVEAFHPNAEQRTSSQYFQDMTVLKNQRIAQKVKTNYPAANKIIVCEDLGIHKDSWLEIGFKKVDCEYYFVPYIEKLGRATWKQKLTQSKMFRIIRKPYVVIRHILTDTHLSVAYHEGKKYVFWGSLNRIAYRLNISFQPASRLEYLRSYIDRIINTQPNTIHISTLHEGHNKWKDSESMNVKLLQDGYLPPNYTSNYLYFKGLHTVFYTWDVLGQLTFQHFGLPSVICPFRKKIYLPRPNYPANVKKVLCVASGSGDWTAIKNRSDEDKMLYAFGQIARKYPEIEFVYRCHPVWVHPEFQGVNSINRAIQYFQYLGLPNIRISSNIPNPFEESGFRLSFSRSSFEEDLKGVDLVFGEHSVAMIDSGLKNILFCSVNVTGRRNLFKGISDLGFPHCESIDEISQVIESVHAKSFVERYNAAVDNYNLMTDKEE